MKNFSTVSARFAGVALLASVLAAPAFAAKCDFRPNAPDQHTVVRGDTLWDISGKFLEKPWCWPQVWDMNKDEIRNPHWIYPGQVIYFDRKAGRLSLNKPGANGSGGAGDPGVNRIQPQLRTEGLGRDAVRSIPSNVIEPFLAQPMIVEANELAGAPRIIASQEGHLYLGKDDKVYASGKLNGGASFQVFRPGNPLRDPDSDKIVAYEAVFLGTVKLDQEAKTANGAHTFIVSQSKREIGVGDLLMPAPPTPIINYVPHAPDRLVHARVMSIYDGVGYAGQNQIVTVNRGSVDGLDVGSVLQLYHTGRTVADPDAPKGWTGMRKTMIKLPDEQYGTLFIFRIFKHVSYGLIMTVTEPVQVGDTAKSPE